MTPKKRILLMLSAGVLLLIAAMSAMLSSSDDITNRFQPGRFDIVLEEPHWTPDHDSVVPNEELPKDPQVRNKGEVDAFVFVEVTVPYYDELITESLDGTEPGGGNDPGDIIRLTPYWVLYDRLDWWHEVLAAVNCVTGEVDYIVNV